MKTGVNVSANAICVQFFLRKTKKTFCKYLHKRQVSDTKVFWENAKPLFSDKHISSKITLAEKNSIVVDENKIANKINNYCFNIT